jgi:hypothetical protein
MGSDLLKWGLRVIDLQTGWTRRRFRKIKAGDELRPWRRVGDARVRASSIKSDMLREFVECSGVRRSVWVCGIRPPVARQMPGGISVA